MATKKKKTEPVVRCFEVGQPTLHPKGHTIYKISQKIIHVDAPEKEVEELQVWRRYNDIKKLYAAMFKLHKALHRRDEFPPFARSQVFGRFDETVIIERMRSAQDLLNFIGQRVYMVNSKAFQQFFEGSEKVEPKAKTEDILQPMSLGHSLKPSKITAAATCDDSSDTESLSSATDLQSVTETPEGEQEILEDLLGGVWKYRQVADEISLEGCSSDEQTDFTDESALNTPLPDAELSFFDPLTMPEGLPQKTGSDATNEWLLSAMSVCSADDAQSATNSDALKTLGQDLFIDSSGELFTASPRIQHLDEADASSGGFGELTSAFDVKPKKSGTVLECGKGDLTMSPMHNEPAKRQSGSKFVSSDSTSSPSVSDHGSATASPKRSPKKVLSASDLQEKADYIVMAANQISLAQQCEANNNYNMAFSYYKSGVGILLTGVQKDENAQRREVVRRKTARYLIKAEELYHKYLADVEEQERNRWDTGQPSPAKELLTPNVAFLQGAMAEMRKFKVLGIVDKVILVMDPDTEGTYIIKVLQKQCGTPSVNRKSVIPNYIPYMVRLYKFFETDNAIFLLLQYASGGKLWTYVGAYLNQHQNDFEIEVLDDPHEKGLRSRSSTKSSKTDSATTASTITETIMLTTEHLDNVKNTDVDKERTKDNYVELFMDETVGYSKAMLGDDKDDPSDISMKKSPNPAVNRVKQLDHQDIDFLSLDGSHDSHSFRKALSGGSNARKLSSFSSSFEQFSRQNSEMSGHNLTNEQDGFRELLQDTKPSLENFSINSFDSDSGPGSRYESTTSEHIESIPEVSEISPLNSPYRKSQSLPQSPNSDVFTEVGAPLSNHGQNTSTSTDKEIDIHMQSPSHSTPRPKMLLPVSVNSSSNCAEPDEPSIYDTFKPADSGDSTSSCSPSSPTPLKLKDEHFIDSNKGAPQDARSSNINENQSPRRLNILQSTKSPTNNSASPLQDALSSGSERGSSTPRSDRSFRPDVFRQPSQERSAETPVRPRKRNLSSVFAELDLAEDERRRKLVRLPEGCVKQWGAELIVAISQLHTMGIIVGDLHPDNVLLGERGHVLLTYQCQWNVADHDTREDSLLQGYAAPEMVGINEPTQACDWWSLGTLLYELLTGKSFGLHHPAGINSHTQMFIPDDLSAEAQSLLQELLRFDPQERLGSGLDGSADVRLHPFFNGIQWNELQGQMST